MQFDEELDYKSISDRELAVLNFWEKEKIFKKSEVGIKPVNFLEKLREKIFGKRDFIFYDGPPFATGVPHHGHLLQSAIKDAIPRYKTMRGFVVSRRWGWDCHGLPLEVEVEKELGIKSKPEIIKYGIGKFNKDARDTVLRYTKEWKTTIQRFGRFVDMENDYRTMDLKYTESIWSLFHRLHKKGYVKEDFRVSHFCTRCSTVLANNEVSLGYKKTKDKSVYVLFPLKDDKDTFLVAWTTTPWTLFGNFALAVNKNLKYVKVNNGGKKYIIIENKKDLIDGDVEETMKVEDLIGLKYEPIFPFFQGSVKEGKAWKVYDADFVTKEDGTGIVHIAPMYGLDDFKLGKKFDLPLVHHVTKNGVFADNLGGFSNLKAKCDDSDEKIINELKRTERLLKEEVIEHEYPFCWRCDSPLLNYATESWFIKVPSFRDKIIEENKRINWIPKHIRDGRFGNWIKDSPDWAVSRSRFWGAPIPIWKNKKTNKYIVVDSLRTLKEKMKTRNKYLFVRHGQSISNVNGFHNAYLGEKNKSNTLTDLGLDQVKKVSEDLGKYKVNKIFSSPLGRTKETAEVIGKKNNITPVFDERLREVDYGSFEGGTINEISLALGSDVRISETIGGGESYRDLLSRLENFFRECEEKYKNEVIVVVTHSSVIKSAKLLKNYDEPKFYKRGKTAEQGVVHEIDIKLLPKNEIGEVDVHRPYIDGISLTDDDDMEYDYVGEVFDCWFESGAMPYASNYYPINTINSFDPVKRKGFPADFIAEAVDQTRGWFHSLLVLGVGGFNSTAYKNVITTGLIRAGNGIKMSKSLKNYVDPVELIKSYGADSLRQYLLSSPAVRGEDMNFLDSGVEEIQKKIFMRLHNCLLFYKNYSSMEHRKGGSVLLDRFILARLQEVYEAVTNGLENYELDSATNPIFDFVDDLSSWYLRRSRERLRSNDIDGAHSRETLRIVLKEFSKIIAPIAPFYAEYLFNALREKSDPESVHLCNWPSLKYVDKKSISSMKVIREIVSKAHDKRVREKVKVRQPLSSLTVDKQLNEEEKSIIMNEINVKKVLIGNEFILDVNITEDLRGEGISRELIRKIQEERKKKKLSVDDTTSVKLMVSEEMKKIFSKHMDEIKSVTRTNEILFVPKLEGEKFDISGEEIVLEVNI